MKLFLFMSNVIMKEKSFFPLYFAHLFVPLRRTSKVLTLEKMQINLVFYSLNRTFAGKRNEYYDTRGKDSY